MDTLSERIKSLRVKRFGEKGGQAEIARKLDIAQSTYAAYENRDIKTLPAKVAMKLSEITGASLQWIVFGTGEMYGKDSSEFRVQSSEERNTVAESVAPYNSDDIQSMRDYIARLERRFAQLHMRYIDLKQKTEQDTN